MKTLHIALLALLGTGIGLRAADVSDLTYINNTIFVMITDCAGSASGTLEIPAMIEGVPVMFIWSYAFERCTHLTSVTIPDSVTSIGDHAFKDCSSLENLTIGNSVTSIGSFAFEYCTNLTSITIPDGVTRIEGQTFWGCSSLTSITIPDGVTSIRGQAFAGCTRLESVVFGDSLTSIKSLIFWNGLSLVSIYFKGNAPSIEANSFQSVEGVAVFITPTATGFGETFAGFPVFIVDAPTDSDGDGVPDDDDAFPNDPNEIADADSDGVGDNADAFPNDPTETADSDSDRVGNNADVFPNDPTEWADCDNDGVGDNADARSGEQIAQLQLQITQLQEQLVVMTAERDARPILAEVQDARVGSIVVEKDWQSGEVSLSLGLEKTEDGVTWTAYEGGTWTETDGGKFTLSFPLTETKNWVRLALKE